MSVQKFKTYDICGPKKYNRAAYLGVCAHVRSRNISMRPNEIMDLLCKDTGKPLKLTRTQILWIATDPTLRSTIRYTDNGCLPCH